MQIYYMYYVYVLQSTKYRNLYTGYSSNLKERLEEHNKGKVDITKQRRPFELIYLRNIQKSTRCYSLRKVSKNTVGKELFEAHINTLLEFDESVVQLVERCIHIAKVTGSSPVGFTNLIYKFHKLLSFSILSYEKRNKYS